MFGLLRRWARQTTRPKTPPRHARPRLEALEGRDAPSTLTLSVSYGAGRSVTLSGTLGDHPNPSMQQIDFGGQVGGSTWTNMQGQFSVTLAASGLGDVRATAHDGTSNTPTVTLTDVMPTLTFNASEGTNHVWTFYGHVTYAGRPTQGMLVYLGGAPVSLTNQTAPVDSAGNYVVNVTLNGTTSDNGTASARALTPWGNFSDFMFADVLQSGT